MTHTDTCFEKTEAIKSSEVLGLLKISIPLMLSSLSGSLMLLCDRFFLAQYSLGAFNALVSLGALITMFQIGVNVFACTADVFVGQFNGANKKEKICSPTWQMIGFSILTSIIFIPLAVYVPYYLPLSLKNEENAIFYYRLIVSFNALSPLACALSTFFVGIKNTFVPLLSTVVGNVVNLVLNMLLIFGVAGWIPEMGIQGAAIATVTGELVSVAILSMAFFSSYNRRIYYTACPIIDFKLFWSILKVGGPNAIAQLAIAAAWSSFFILMHTLGEASITLASIIQTIFGFFAFIIQGMSRGISTIAANLLGQGQEPLIRKVLSSGIKLCFFFCLMVSLFLLVFPNIIIQLLFAKQDFPKIMSYLSTLKFTLFWGCLSFLFKSIRALFSGLFTASGNTKFVMMNETITIWLFFIMPVWISITLFHSDVSWAYFIAFIHNLITVYFYYRKTFRENRNSKFSLLSNHI